MYQPKDFKDWLFLDIETVSVTETLDQLPKVLGPNALKHWANKAKYKRANDPESAHLDDAQMYTRWASVFPEFSKIITISVGQIKWDDNQPIPKIRSIYDKTEAEILVEFMDMMRKVFQANMNAKIAGHNVKYFDLPCILKRSIVYNIDVPENLHLQKCKPWALPLVDTAEIWKFGNYAGGASLSLITDLLGLPSSKDNMDGSEVTKNYWQKYAIEEIKEYCEKDVISAMNLMLKYGQLPIIK